MNAHVLPRIVLVAAIVATMSAPIWADGWGHIPDPWDRSLACASTTAGDVYAFPNTPSTFCQCMGCGVGAGYHAPLIFNPVPTWRRNHHGVTWRSAPPMPQPPLHHHHHELTPQPSQLFSAPSVMPSVLTPNGNGAGRRQLPVQEPQSPSETVPGDGSSSSR